MDFGIGGPERAAADDLGYFCEGSPLRFWRADGRSLYDTFGQGYTLLRLDPGVEVKPLRAAARARGVPLAVVVVDLVGEAPPEACRHALVLVRDDQHVAWRGHQVPGDAQALVERMRGARP